MINLYARQHLQSSSMLLKASLALIFLTRLVCANPTYREFVLHEKRDNVPAGFSLDGPPAADSTLNLRFALTQGNISGLEKTLYDVSSPDSDNYGKHLSKEEVAAFVRPLNVSTSTVNEWLSSNGLTVNSASFAGDWFDVAMPVDKANELLDAEFSVFTHTESGSKITRTLSYAIPAALKDHLSLVHPTVKYVPALLNTCHLLTYKQFSRFRQAVRFRALSSEFGRDQRSPVPTQIIWATSIVPDNHHAGMYPEII